MSGLGKLIIIAGLALVVIGALVMLEDRLPFKLGRLPGDIVWERGNAKFYFPLTTLILLNLGIWLVLRLFNRN